MHARQVILVIGVPRSGSTWLTDVLSSADDTDLVMEPDNEKTSVLASRLKQGLPRFPRLAPPDAGPPELGLLWDFAFTSRWAPLLSRSRTASVICGALPASRESAINAKSTGLPDATHAAASHRVLDYLHTTSLGPWRPKRIVKTVHAVLCPEWVVQRCNPAQVIVIMRHPMAVLQSWRRMQMPDAFRLAGGGGVIGDLSAEEALARMAEQLCGMLKVLEDAIARNPDWQVVSHETLCADPAGEMRAVAEACALPWDSAMEQTVVQMNRSGAGYKPQRDAAGEIDKWKSEASAADIAAVSDVFDRAGMRHLL